MTDYVIQAKGLSRHFGKVKAVQDLDLTIEKSRIYGFLGPNGSGKTTAIRLLTGLLKPTDGTIDVLGYRLPQQAEKLRRHIGYMTQTFSLYRDLTVKENLDFVARIYSIHGRARKQRVDDLIECYDLVEKGSQMAGNLSGGERQRLSLAAAVMHRPQLLFLDEPTSAVDPENRREFWEQLFDLCDTGTSILVSTHFMDEAERCHQLAILETGLKRADGSPDRLMRDMDAQVVEITSTNLRRMKQSLVTLPEVLSVAQLGSRLRVLVRKSTSDPVAFLREQSAISTEDQLDVVRPSLEDVFVTCTGGRRQ